MRRKGAYHPYQIGNRDPEVRNRQSTVSNKISFFSTVSKTQKSRWLKSLLTKKWFLQTLTFGENPPTNIFHWKGPLLRSEKPSEGGPVWKPSHGFNLVPFAKKCLPGVGVGVRWRRKQWMEQGPEFLERTDRCLNKPLGTLGAVGDPLWRCRSWWFQTEFFTGQRICRSTPFLVFLWPFCFWGVGGFVFLGNGEGGWDMMFCFFGFISIFCFFLVFFF